MIKLSEKKGYNFSTGAVAILIFFISIFVILGIRKLITSYKEVMLKQYEINQEENFKSVLDGALNLGKSSVNETTQTLELQMHDQLNMDTLRMSLENSKSYPEFEQLLRDNLQKNVYTQYTSMSGNRNNIFVLANERVIASYTHDGSLLTDGASLDSTINVRDIIGETFYNTELSLDAIDKIESQYSGIIVWQSRAPENSDIPKVSKMSRDDIINIFKKYGVAGLESYEVLIPGYITNYGNIFGEYDIPGETNTTSNNKIIIVQKLNLVDYINCNFPNLFDDSSVSNTVEKFDHVNMMVNVLIILDCVAMIAYALVFVSIYNHKLIVDGLSSDSIKEEKQE